MERSPAEVHATCDQACEILQNTRDGEDLAPEHLKLVEMAVNGFLNDEGKQAFQDLHRQVVSGRYAKPWLHGIEHLTMDHEGYVYWKGHCVEHFSHSPELYDKRKEDAEETARRCRILEDRGIEPTLHRVVSAWREGTERG